MTPMEYTFQEIEKESRRLVRLFDDPQPGLFTWICMVGEILERLAELRTVQEVPPNGG